MEAKLFGILAEFERAEALLEAARRVREAGYEHFDAFTPFPLKGLSEAMQLKTHLARGVLVCGLLGAVAGFSLQYFAAVVGYPLNVGGRPLNSWPSFVPVTFEVTILMAALGALLWLIGSSGLPMPHHPVFNAERFSRASQDRFFLLIEATDAQFDPARTRALLESLEPYAVSDVPS